MTNDTTPWTDLGGGIERRIAQHSKELMLVEVRFARGAVGAPHSHPHTQSTYVLSGQFEFQIGEERTTLGRGDSCSMPPDVTHSCVCLEEGILLDVFSPRRDDFL